MKSQLDTIESAIADIKKGKLIIVVDDEDRENEGDFITAARNVTPEIINFMSKHGRGLICAPITESRCEELKLNLQELDARQVINKVADNLALQLQEKSGALNLKLNADNNRITADEVHFSNIIFNLLDNAMKYSTNAPYIEVETLNAGDSLVIKIKDNGIGMDRETQTRIFEKFFRAHTGNLHNVKGFGLGLSYVKAIVDAHDGKIKVESAPGKGSTFTLTFPLREA